MIVYEVAVYTESTTDFGNKRMRYVPPKSPALLSNEIEGAFEDGPLKGVPTLRIFFLLIFK